MCYVLSLKPSDFDDAGNFQFTSKEGELYKRGGLDYFQPSSDWVRLGLRVRGRYDSGNDDWLRMDGHPGEWAVGFHGSTIEGTSSICDSRNFRVGPRNMFESDSDTNKLSDQYGQPCGKGIYFASSIQIAEGYSKASVDDKQVVMQVSFSTFPY